MLAHRQLARTALPSLRNRSPRCAVCHSRQLASKAEPSEAGPSKAASHPPSILKAGTVMKGLSILKDQPDPVALPDDEYPAWLWGLTDAATAKKAEANGAEGRRAQESGGEKDGAFDFKAERRRLRAANKDKIKGANLLKST